MEKEKIYCLDDLEVKESYTGLYDEYDIYYTPDKKGEVKFSHNWNGDGDMSWKIIKESPDTEYLAVDDYKTDKCYLIEFI